MTQPPAARPCWLALALLVGALAATSSHAASAPSADPVALVAKGRAATGDGDYPTAAQAYGEAAQFGDTIAERELAALYEKGLGVRQDDCAAMTWYMKAAAQGDAAAEEAVGRFYDAGRGAAGDEVAALAWLRKAIAHDDARANYDLGRMYELKRTPNPDPASRPLNDYRAAIGIAEALDALGRLEGDRATALDDYQAAAALGNAHAQYAMGHFHLSSERPRIVGGITKNPTMGRKLLEASADQDWAQAEFELAQLELIGAKPDRAAAMTWLAKAAAHGAEPVDLNDPEAVCEHDAAVSAAQRIAEVYLDGKGVPKDTALSKLWSNEASVYEQASAATCSSGG